MVFAISVFIYLAVEIFFYLFHFSVLILLIARRNSAFKGPFFNILRIVFVADLFSFLITITIQKISFIPFLIPFYQQNAFFAIFCYNFATSMPIIQFAAHSLMAFNRFTLIWFPFKNTAIWKYQWYTAVIMILPCLHIIWRWNVPAVVIYLSENSITISLVNLGVMSLAYSITTGTYLFTTSLAAIFNVLAFVKFYFHKQAISSIQLKEKNLLFMSFVAMISQLLRTTYNIQRMFFPADEGMTVFFNTAYPFLCDIFALSGSLSLFVLSATTRREYKRFYFCKYNTQVMIISSQTKLQPMPKAYNNIIM